jgi:peptidoglycan-N-acetylglucosamine deacetylase
MANESSKFTWPAGKTAAVSLSFDDARTTQIDRGIEILDRHKIKATFYVSPGPMEARLDAWKRVVAAGHEIGNHTDTHPCSGNLKFSRGNALEDYTLGRIEQDILTANERIEELLRVKPATFAYPCGQSFVGRGEHVRSFVPFVAQHFLIGRGAFGGPPNDPAYFDPAQAQASDADCATFEQLKAMIDTAVAEGAWLILFAHEVDETRAQSVHPDVLDQLCQHCMRDPQLWCSTLEEVGRYVLGHRRGERR